MLALSIYQLSFLLNPWNFKPSQLSQGWEEGSGQGREGSRHWRDAKKWNWEEKEKYGIHISYFWLKKRTRIFAKKKSAIFSYFQKIKRNFKNKSHDLRGDQDFENSNFSWQEREIYLFFSVLKTKNYLCHKEEFSSPIPKCSCWLKLKYCSTTQTYFPFLQNTAAQNPTIQLNMISHQNWKRNWGKNQEEKLSFFSQNFDSWEENLFAKSHSIEKRKRNFLQNLEFREENENFVFKILTIENISRNEHSILQLEIEKNGPFPLEIFSRSRISSMPEMYLLH